ncbi:MAG TPA: SurA N-terminal domain-containing protein [Bacteroidales bacterium]|nr:SurA N-terminal domain-containing protein [Bacteroidales bacterium]
MPVLEKIRSKAGILIAGFIGFALLAFILGDFLNSGQSLFRQSQMKIAEMNGKSVSFQEYEQRLAELEEIYKAKTNQSTIQDNVRESLKEQAWLELTFNLVVEPEYDKLGLAVGEDELADQITGNNPSPVIRQNFGDPNTGQINTAAVNRLWNSYKDNPTYEAIVLSIEKDIKMDRAFSKYTNIIRKGLYVPKFLAKNDFIESNEKVDVSFLAKRYSDISDSAVKVTNADLKKYYGDHKYLFEQTPSRDIEYVTFDIVPSQKDYKDASEYINKVLPEFKAAEDAKQYVNANSDIIFDNKYYKAGQLSDSLDKFLFSAKEGDTYGPYTENETFKIARLVKVASMPDSVKARHILVVPTEQSQAGVDKAKQLADSIKNAVEKGADFAALASKYSADKQSAVNGGDLGWFPEGQMPFNDDAFSMAKGQTKVAETRFGYHVLQVTDKGPEAKKVQVAFMARKVDASTATNQAIFARASKFAAENRTHEQFNKAVENSKGAIVKKLASSITLNDKFIAGLEQPRELIRWAYNSSKGEVSEVINLQNAFVVAVVSQIREDKFATLEQVQSEIELAVRKEKKGDLLAQQINKQKEGVRDIQTLAGKLNVNVENAAGISFSSFSIGSAGIEPKLIATATTIKPNELSQPVKGNNGVYVAFVTSKVPAQGTDYTQSIQKLNYTMQSRSGYETLEALKKLAKIEDKRGKFY